MSEVSTLMPMGIIVLGSREETEAGDIRKLEKIVGSPDQIYFRSSIDSVTRKLNEKETSTRTAVFVPGFRLEDYSYLKVLLQKIADLKATLLMKDERLIGSFAFLTRQDMLNMV